MNILLICLIITICYVIIIDWLQAPLSIASAIIAALTNNKIKHIELKKPFSCSLCMTFWTTLIVLSILAPELIWLSLVYCLMTKYILYILTILDALISNLLIVIERLVNKIKI